ncbi:LytR/AlgR family response regulator transcription factor [Ekhidna sp. To15]|uniref:LytR/AlgR family response regulator transcription factor n=1 Tax=Ekhidna sp. To15 TaxID=3395267 RepID=UPI003F51F316
MIRAIIVDDEFLARQRVMKLLESQDEIKVVAEAKNGELAVKAIDMQEPDLIFLDVQMPDFDGFEVVKRMKPKHSPYIVFTTAYDSYAIQAFDIHALDYLLKPVDEDRFNESIKKILEHFEAQKTSSFNKKLMKMVKDFERPPSKFIHQITIADRGWEQEIDLDEVFYVEANGNYVNLQTADKTHLYRSTMNTLANQLDPKEFLRIHRSVIVNRRYIKKCTYISNNEYEFIMKDGKTLQSGRSYRQEIMQYLG